LLPQKKQIYAKLKDEIKFKPDLAYFVPVKIEFTNAGEVWATHKLTQNSGEFAALSETDGFIELPRGRDHYHAGDVFKFFSWGNLA